MISTLISRVMWTSKIFLWDLNLHNFGGNGYVEKEGDSSTLVTLGIRYKFSHKLWWWLSLRFFQPTYNYKTYSLKYLASYNLLYYGYCTISSRSDFAAQEVPWIWVDWASKTLFLPFPKNTHYLLLTMFICYLLSLLLLLQLFLLKHLTCSLSFIET